MPRTSTAAAVKQPWVIRHALNGLLQDMRAAPDLDAEADAAEVADIFARAVSGT